MSPFRLHPLPGHAWPALPDPRFSLLWSAYQRLDRTQWLAPAEVEAGQLRQVRELLAHARAHVPYYRRLLAERGIEPNDVRTAAAFRRVPLLSRRALQESRAALTADALPAGTVAGDVVSTSGSSGIPVAVGQTNVVRLWWFACYLRDLEWGGIDPRGTLASVRYFKTSGPEGERARAGVRLPYWNELLAQLIENGPSFAMDVHQDPRHQLSWLRGVRPDYLLSFPSNLEFLAGLVRDSGEPLPGLRAVLAIGETLTAEAREHIESALAAPVRNTYSCAEIGYLASPCPAGGGLHVHAENVLLEVLNERDEPCAEGEPGRVVATALHNTLNPIVRYEIMDRAAPGPPACGCGRGLPLLAWVEGKTHPVLALPDGRRVNSGRLAVALRKVGGFHQFRVTQHEPARFTIEVVPSRAWTDGHADRIRAGVRAFCGAEVRADVVPREVIPLRPGGKAADIVTEVPHPG